MQNGLTNGKTHVYSDKQIHVDMYTIVSFVIQSGQVSESGMIAMSLHVNSLIIKLGQDQLISKPVLYTKQPR